jgi:hypothetical protein
MKVLEGDATLKNKRGSTSRTFSSRLGSPRVVIPLTPPSKPYCDGPSVDKLRTEPVKTGDAEATSIWSVVLCSFKRLRWYSNPESEDIMGVKVG